MYLYFDIYGKLNNLYCHRKSNRKSKSAVIFNNVFYMTL